jgi:hypothetical protein
VVQLRTPAGRFSYQLDLNGTRFDPLAENPNWPEQAPVWRGKLHPDDVTVDLRLEEPLITS